MRKNLQQKNTQYPLRHGDRGRAGHESTDGEVAGKAEDW
jgi:hypothetical protein